MSGTIPNMDSVNQMPKGSKKQRFITGNSTPSMPSGGARQSRVGNMGPTMSSVHRVSPGTSALEAKRAVQAAETPGANLHL